MVTPQAYPPWVVLHVPHDSTAVPAEARAAFVLDDAALQQELLRMTDHHTLALFAGAQAPNNVRAPVSRLVVDVERFAQDADEPMAARGMGVIYEATSQGAPLRRPLTEAERAALISRYYAPHHARLEAAVTQALAQFGRCLVLDCHSFPSVALPYEQADPAARRPGICIGSDDFHTRSELADAFVEAFTQAGWDVALNEPFAGALVPASRYRRDARVQAVMVELNRELYMREDDGSRRADFERTAERVRGCCLRAVDAVGAIDALSRG